MGRTEKVVSRLQNPRAQLPVVANPTNPSLEREASCRRSHWAAVSNPRISVWSIVAASLLRLLYHLSHKGGNRT